MAAKKAQVKVVRTQSKPIVIRQTTAPRRRAPTAMVVASPRAITHHRRRSSGSGSSVGALTPNKVLAVGLGGALFGFLEKQFGDKLPTLPVLGRSGTITVAAYFFAKNAGAHSNLVKDVCLAGAAISGYQLGKTGKVSGEDGVIGEEI